jgi:hypothetical protein
MQETHRETAPSSFSHRRPLSNCNRVQMPVIPAQAGTCPSPRYGRPPKHGRPMIRRCFSHLAALRQPRLGRVPACAGMTNSTTGRECFRGLLRKTVARMRSKKCAGDRRAARAINTTGAPAPLIRPQLFCASAQAGTFSLWRHLNNCAPAHRDRLPLAGRLARSAWWGEDVGGNTSAKPLTVRPFLTPTPDPSPQGGGGEAPAAHPK